MVTVAEVVFGGHVGVGRAGSQSLRAGERPGLRGPACTTSVVRGGSTEAGDPREVEWTASQVEAPRWEKFVGECDRLGGRGSWVAA